MPGYIKIYYALAVYLLLWAAGMCVWLIYMVARFGITDSDSFIGILLACLVITGVFGKGIISLKAWQCYRQAIPITAIGRRLFIVMYIFTIIFGICALMFIMFLIPDSIRNNDGRVLPPATVILFDAGIILCCIAAAYFATTDMMLLKAINNKHEKLVKFDTKDV